MQISPRVSQLATLSLWVVVPFVLALLICLPALVTAAEEPAPEPAGEPADEAVPTPSHHVPRTEAAISIDGVLDDPPWEHALRLELPYETHPGDSTPAPVRTEMLLTHDDRQLYAAFIAHVPDPREIRAHLRDRDDAFSDDFVGIVLDTFNDERRAFEFFVNPLGVQMDLIQDDVSGREDASWDTIWDSAGSIGESAYHVEMALPFSSLRFPKSDGELTFGLDAVRIYPRDLRRHIHLIRIDRDRSCYLCQTEKVTGFAGIRPGSDYEVVPSLVTSRSEARESYPRGPFESSNEVEPGVSASWALTSNLILSGTVNPDFSQVEADAAQLDVNRRFALFFPEKRPFFLEGAGFFRTPLQAAFTRSVADPSFGVKLTGKQGRDGVGVLFARDEQLNLILPGPQGSDTATLEEPTYTTVVRYLRDVGKTASLGLLATDREGSGYFNRLVGIDAMIRPRSADTFRAQYLYSATRYPDEIVDDFAQPAGTLRDSALRLHYDNGTRNSGWWVVYEEIGRDFRADAGFLPQVGTRQGRVGMNRRFWSDDDDAWWSRVQIGGDLDYTAEEESGDLLEREAEAWFNLDAALQSHVEFGGGLRERHFDDVEFDETFVWFWSDVRPTASLRLELGGNYGDDIDFANTRAGRAFGLRPEIEVNFNRHLRLYASHDYRRLDVDRGRLFTANLSQARVVYQFNVRAFVRAIFQYSNVRRDPSLYDDEVDGRSRDFFTQLLFSYKLNPRTLLFVGYSDDYEGDEVTPLVQQHRTFFVKMSYSFRL